MHLEKKMSSLKDMIKSVIDCGLYSIGELAIVLHVDQATLRSYCDGTLAPAPETLKAIDEIVHEDSRFPIKDWDAMMDGPAQMAIPIENWPDFWPSLRGSTLRNVAMQPARDGLMRLLMVVEPQAQQKIIAEAAAAARKEILNR